MQGNKLHCHVLYLSENHSIAKHLPNTVVCVETFISNYI